MADKEDGDALALQIAGKLEQLLDLVSGERRSRLVHDQDANVERNGLSDFDRLLGSQCQSARRISNVQRDAELAQDPFSVVKHLPPLDHRSTVLMTDENVLGDIEIGKQQRLLINGGDAQALRLGGAANRDRPARQKQLAAIGLMHAGYDLDERRLAGPVLPEQGVNLASVKRKGNVIERLGGVETLGDAANLQDRRDDRRSVGKLQRLVHVRQRPPVTSMIAPVT